MIQMYSPEFARDENELKAFNVFNALVEPFKIAVQNYYDNAERSVELGRLFFENDFSPITKILPSEQIIMMYHSWHELYKNIETCDYMIQLIIDLYKLVEIDIVKVAPKNISLRVAIKDIVDFWWNKDENLNAEIEPEVETQLDILVLDSDSTGTDDATGVVLTKVANYLPVDSLISVLNDVIYPGLYFKVELKSNVSVY